MNNFYKYRLYGRSKGRKKNNQINDAALKIKIKNFDQSKYNILDIGCGFGESTIEIAKLNKNKNVIACEKYLDGINNIAEKAEYFSLSNISIYYGNVHQFLDEYCMPKSLSEIWILFPDPWPKKRHFKRRLINKDFFYELKNFLKSRGTINIASDSKSYLSEIIKCIFEVRDDFLWINQTKDGWSYSDLTLPKTKYFKKALENGLNPFYIKLMKL